MVWMCRNSCISILGWCGIGALTKSIFRHNRNKSVVFERQYIHQDTVRNQAYVQTNNSRYLKFDNYQITST